jgi:hypothetical protein
MIHLKYECQVTFVKLPLIWLYWCLKLIFENATAGCESRGWHVARLSCRTAFQDERTYQLIVQNCPPHIDTETLLVVASVPLKFRDKESALFGRWLKIATRRLTTRFTRGRVREWKNGHNSVTVQNRAHVYMNLFWSQRPRKSPPAVMP